MIPLPGGTDTSVRCRSTARREKARAIRRRFSTRLEDALQRLETRVTTGRVKDRAVIARALGRLQERYSPRECHDVRSTRKSGAMETDR